MPHTPSDDRARGLWRLGVFFAVFSLTWTIRAFSLVSLDHGLEPTWLRRLYLDGVRCLLWVVPAIWFVRSMRGERTMTHLKLTTPIEPIGLRRAGTMAILFLAGMMGFAILIEGKTIDRALAADPAHWLGIVLTLGFATFAEELLYRGLFLNDLSAFVGFVRANLITSFLFAAIHWPGWLARGTALSVMLSQSLGVFLVGLVAGILFRATNSLWPSVAFHLLNNMLVSVLR